MVANVKRKIIYEYCTNWLDPSIIVSTFRITCCLCVANRGRTWEKIISVFDSIRVFSFAGVGEHAAFQVQKRREMGVRICSDCEQLRFHLVKVSHLNDNDDPLISTEFMNLLDCTREGVYIVGGYRLFVPSAKLSTSSPTCDVSVRTTTSRGASTSIASFPVCSISPEETQS